MAMRETPTSRSDPPPDPVGLSLSSDLDLGVSSSSGLDPRADGTRPGRTDAARPGWAPLGRAWEERPRLTHPAPVVHRDPCAVADLLIGMRYVFREGVTG
jgi:hypothetical protein